MLLSNYEKEIPGISGDHLYYNLYIIRVHENEEIGSFSAQSSPFSTPPPLILALGVKLGLKSKILA